MNCFVHICSWYDATGSICSWKLLSIARVVGQGVWWPRPGLCSPVELGNVHTALFCFYPFCESETVHMPLCSHYSSFVQKWRKFPSAAWKVYFLGYRQLSSCRLLAWCLTLARPCTMQITCMLHVLLLTKCVTIIWPRLQTSVHILLQNMNSKVVIPPYLVFFFK